MFLKDMVHNVNVVFANSKDARIKIIFGCYGIDGKRTTEGSYFAYYPRIELEFTEKIDYIELLKKLVSAYPELRYEKVYPTMHLYFENAKIYVDQFRHLKVIEYNGDPLYPKEFSIVAKEIRENFLQAYIEVKSLTLEGEVIL